MSEVTGDDPAEGYDAFPPTLDEIEERYRDYAKMGRAVGMDEAADNLERFLNKGGDKTVSRDHLRQFRPIRTAEETNNGRFSSALEGRGADGKEHKWAPKLQALKEGEEVVLPSDYWEVERNAFEQAAQLSPDFAVATGESEFRSEIHGVVARRVADQITVEGVVTHTFKDPYDWHSGAWYADGARRLEAEGRGKSYMYSGAWKQKMKATVSIRGGKLTNAKTRFEDVD